MSCQACDGAPSSSYQRSVLSSTSHSGRHPLEGRSRQTVANGKGRLTLRRRRIACTGLQASSRAARRTGVSSLAPQSIQSSRQWNRWAAAHTVVRGRKSRSSARRRESCSAAEPPRSFGAAWPYGGLQMQASRRRPPGSQLSRSACTARMRSAQGEAAKFFFATARAPPSTSTAQAERPLPARARCCARSSARSPVPVPASRRRSSRGPASGPPGPSPRAARAAKAQAAWVARSPERLGCQSVKLWKRRRSPLPRYLV
mmetsp:Transcript_11640/g.37160  ORF Transcript_11640/g.37160 Transcript_11640/m.37160 type:complete len:258 (-) Transcript_11640:811-1584(-)